MPVSLYSRYYHLDSIETGNAAAIEQRLLPKTPAPANSLLHTIVGNETFDQLAFHYYGRADLWWRIADANPGLFPLAWKAGDTVIIPPLQPATQTPRR